MNNNRVQIELDENTFQIANIISDAQGITVEEFVSKLIRNHALAILETEAAASTYRGNT